MDTTFPLRINTPSNVSSRTLNTYFTVFWICMTVGYLMILPMAFLGAASVEPDTSEPFTPLMLLLLGSLLLYVVGFLILIISTVFWCMLHYQLWKTIPKEIARTTPGKALGFLFIPLFGFYWVFVACKGLGEDMNRTLQQRGTGYQVNESLGLPFCILFILCCIVPFFTGYGFLKLFIDFVIAIAYLVVLICFYQSLKDGALALIEQETRLAHEPQV